MGIKMVTLRYLARLNGVCPRPLDGCQPQHKWFTRGLLYLVCLQVEQPYLAEKKWFKWVASSVWSPGQQHQCQDEAHRKAYWKWEFSWTCFNKFCLWFRKCALRLRTEVQHQGAKLLKGEVNFRPRWVQIKWLLGKHGIWIHIFRSHVKAGYISGECL